MASQFARRAASRRTSSLGDTGSSLRVLAKAKSSFVAEPMIPLVDKRFVDVLEERKTSMIPTSHIDLRHGVSTGGDADCHTSDSEIVRGQLDEMQGDTVAPSLPRRDSPRVHGG